MMAPVLHVQLLGSLDIHYEGKPPITSLNSNRLQALLAYLLINRRRPQPRTYMAFLFWPDSSEEQALTNLRNLYHLLRQALPKIDDYIQADRQTLHWRPIQPCSLDVENFEGALAQAEAADQQGALSGLRQALEKAVELYQDDLLMSCYSDWVLPERERLRQLFLDAAYRLVGVLESQGDTALALHTANSLLRFDALQETTYRRLMELYALKGDRAGLKRTYETCAAMLERELSIQPSPITRQLYQRLLNHSEISLENSKSTGETGDQSVSSSSYLPEKPISLSPLSSSLISFPLLGRQAELGRLQAAWVKAASGGAQLVLVSGEAGLGKSRLLVEFSAHVRQAGGRVAAARGYSGEGQLAFAPLVAWLRERPLPALEGPWLAEIARLLPEVHAQIAGLPVFPVRLENWQRLRLFEAVARAVLERPQPVLLVLDDLQWCDHDSLDWLRFLMHFDSKAAVLVAASLRPEELPGKRPLQNFLSDLRQTAQLQMINLAPLCPEETATLAWQACGHPLLPDAAARLYQASQGNPFFVIELAAAGWPRKKALNGALPEISPLPPAVEALLHARLERLSPAAGEVIDLAAVAGLRCPYRLLKEEVRLDERRLANALDELADRRILAEERPETGHGTGFPAGSLAYCFTHPLLRQVAWNRLGAAHRRVLESAVQRGLGRDRVAS
jgi:DNA-binding SARP family transcriptional activator